LSKGALTKAALSDSTFLVTAGKNSSILPREGKIAVVRTDVTISDTVFVVVKQSGGAPECIITPSKAVMKSTGDELKLTVDANFSAVFDKIVYTGGDAPWVDFVSESVKGRIFNFTVKPTNKTVNRTANITFKSEDGTTYTGSYTIVQKGATITDADSTALLVLYAGLNGPTMWRDKWSRDMPVSGWSGVTLSEPVAGERRVEGLSLAGVGLLGRLENGSFIVELGGRYEARTRIPLEALSNLRKIDFSVYLGLGGELPVNMRNLIALRELYLHNCNFINSSSGANIPSEWGGEVTINGVTTVCFPYLEKLKLSNNVLTGIIPVAIKEHPNWSDWEPSLNILPQRGGALTTP
jgi:hypothetical protein